MIRSAATYGVVSNGSTKKRPLQAIRAECKRGLASLLRKAAPALCAIAFASVMVAGPAAAQKAPARDWSRTTIATAQGGFLIGNASAPAKLVEYLSYTCPHCAHFVAEATGPIKTQWVSKGTLSVEIRNLVRDRFDLTAALLARCGGAARFTRQHEALFANHEAWIQKASAYQPSLPANASHAQIMTDIAEKTGLIALMQTLGVTPAQSRACITDSKAMDRLMATTSHATKEEGVRGTPSFFVNGRLTDAHDWATLRPLLPASK